MTFVPPLTVDEPPVLLTLGDAPPYPPLGLGPLGLGFLPLPAEPPLPVLPFLPDLPPLPPLAFAILRPMRELIVLTATNVIIPGSLEPISLPVCAGFKPILPI